MLYHSELNTIPSITTTETRISVSGTKEDLQQALHAVKRATTQVEAVGYVKGDSIRDVLFNHSEAAFPTNVGHGDSRYCFYCRVEAKKTPNVEGNCLRALLDAHFADFSILQRKKQFLPCQVYTFEIIS